MCVLVCLCVKYLKEHAADWAKVGFYVRTYLIKNIHSELSSFPE